MKKGYAQFKSYYVIDEETGELIELNLPSDAIADMAKLGVKAGNPLLDEINREIRESSLIEKTKRLFKKLS